MATQTISAGSKSRIDMSKMRSMMSEKHLNQIEKYGPRNTNYNETVRANNKRYDRGESGKTLPRGKVADKTWRPSKRSTKASGR